MYITEKHSTHLKEAYKVSAFPISMWAGSAACYSNNMQILLCLLQSDGDQTRRPLSLRFVSRWWEVRRICVGDEMERDRQREMHNACFICAVSAASAFGASEGTANQYRPLIHTLESNAV